MLGLSGMVLATAMLCAVLAWAGALPWAAATALAGAGACAFLLRRWVLVPLEEFGRGVKRWAYCDLDVPLDHEALAAWPGLESDFHRAQAEVSQVMEGYRSELAQERIRMETLVGSIPDGLVVLNLRGGIIYVNQSAVDILGIAATELRPVGRDIYEPLKPDQRRMQIQDILKNHTTRGTLEISDPSGSKPSRFFRTMVNMFAMPNGAEFGVMLILRDITSERELDSMKEEFFQHVAHDMRAPIFAMQGYLRLLEKSLSLEGHRSDYFDAISKSCEKLMLYIGDTLDAARIETGHFKLQSGPVDPAQLLQRVADLFCPLAREKGIHLELGLPEDRPNPIQADERLLERVLANLISNALKFTPRDGRVTLGMARAGPDQIDFSVTDTGPGIPADQKMRIFEKFRQGRDSQTRGGFGLGLSICRKIVQLHQGSLWVESDAGRGSQFVFRLPMSRKGEQA